MTHYKLIKSLVRTIRNYREQVADFRDRYYKMKQHALELQGQLTQEIDERNRKDKKLFELQMLLKKYRGRGDFNVLNNGIKETLSEIENL